MVVETKFDIGQEVYVLESKKDFGYKTTKVFVKSISINVEKQGSKFLYFVSNGKGYNESGLFKTRQQAQERIKNIF